MKTQENKSKVYLLVPVLFAFALPKYFLERCELPIEQGGLGCSLYFSARTLGTFLGAIVLARYSSRCFMIGNMVVAVLVFLLFMVTNSIPVLLITLFLVGLFHANPV